MWKFNDNDDDFLIRNQQEDLPLADFTDFKTQSTSNTCLESKEIKDFVGLKHKENNHEEIFSEKNLITQWCECLLVVICSNRELIFHSFGDVPITGEGLHILTFIWDSRLFGSEGSLSCHTHCDTGQLFIFCFLLSPRTPETHTCWLWICHYLFYRRASFATGGRTPIPRILGERRELTSCNINILLWKGEGGCLIRKFRVLT